MNSFARAIAGAVSLLAAGCTYPVVAPVPPPAAALATPVRQVPGTWLVHVEPARLTRQAALTGFGCRAASYPVDATAAVTEAIRMALDNAFARIEEGDPETTPAELRRARASGIIIVQPAQFEPRADVEQRGIGATVRATTTLAVNVTVDREFRRAFEGTIEASGDAVVPIGMFDCGAVREAINQATGNAAQQLADRIAGQLAGAPGIRPPPMRARRPPPARPPEPAAPAPAAEPAPATPSPAAPAAPAPAANTPTS